MIQKNSPEFKKKYRTELEGKKEVVANLKLTMSGKRKVTLLYGAKDQEYNNAAFLQEYLKKQ